MARAPHLSRGLTLAFLTLTVLVPFAIILMWSFSFRWAFPNLLPEWSLRAWEYVFDQGAITDALVNSIVVSSIVTVLTLLLGFSAGKALGTRNFRGKLAVEMLILLPALVPVISAVMGMRGIFTWFGLTGTFIGVVMAQTVFALPYMVFGLSSAFKNYDLEYEEVASTLGANRWNILMEVTIPTIFPALVVSCLFAFVVSWSQYLLTIMIGGTAVETLPIELFALMGSGEYGIASAVSIVFVLPVLVLLVLTSRYMMTNGLSNGGSTRT